VGSWPAGDAFFDVLHKALIERRRGTPRFRQGDALGQQPALGKRRTDDGYRVMILLDQDFGALPDLGQDGVDVAGEFGFGNAERPHIHDHSGYSSSWGTHEGRPMPKKPKKQKNRRQPTRFHLPATRSPATNAPHLRPLESRTILD